MGARLRAAREKRDISLRQIAERTRISVIVLEAIERDDIKRLPGGIFTRAFLRTYAVEVGLDPDTTVDDFLAQFPPEAVSAGTVGDPVEDHQAIESDRQAAQTLARLMVISLPIAAVVIYFSLRPSPLRQEAPPPSITAPAPAVTGGSKTSPPPVVETPVGKPVEVATTVPSKPATDAAIEGPVGTGASVVGVTSPATGGSQAPTATGPAATDAASTDVKVPPPAQKRADTAKPAAPDALMMVIDQASPCWVAVAVDGEAVARERLGSGERLELKAVREIVVTVGEDTPCAYTLNGSAGRPLGQPGAIVTRRISPDNYRTYLSR